VAIKNVEANIEARQAELYMEPPGGFIASSLLRGEAHVKETRHRRFKSQELFCIHHVFIGNPVERKAL
jgi:hypothetical protein